MFGPKYKFVPKFSDDTCSYEKGLVIGDQCLQLAKDNPCITPYINTGPQSDDCLRKLWRNSGCTGEKPYNKTFTQLNKDIGNIKNKTFNIFYKKYINFFD